MYSAARARRHPKRPGPLPPGDLFELFGQIRQIGAALWQIAHSGQPAQLARARKVLGDARRALYAILSQDPDGEE